MKKTFRQQLMEDYPENVHMIYPGGCKDCPKSYGYEKDSVCILEGNEINCTKCWDRYLPDNFIKNLKGIRCKKGHLLKTSWKYCPYCGSKIKWKKMKIN